MNYLSFEKLKHLKSPLMQKLKDCIDQPVPMVSSTRETNSTSSGDPNVIHSLKGRLSLLLLMEEIPNNHLGCIKPCK